MQLDFHYYATYCAAYIAGYSHEESLDIAYSAQFVDNCSRTLLAKIKGPSSAATTQLQLELMDARTDYMNAFTQMIYALKYIRGDIPSFKKNTLKRYTDREINLQEWQNS